jgi:DNA primase
MKFSQDFIERVREATNIVEIIAQSTQLKRSGTHRMVGLCPFHGEKTASFSVSEDKQMYYCFGCKRAGNVFTFVQEVRGLAFPEVVEFLSARAGIPLPVVSAEDRGQREGAARRQDLEQKYFRINAFAAEYYAQSLKNQKPSSRVKSYLKLRGLSDETVTRFQLGYAPADWEGLVNALKQSDLSIQEAEEVGIIRRRTDGRTGHYDNFRDRLMFPIHSTTGKVVGFGGRILDDGQPKYLNSSESTVFHKGRLFYGLHEAAKHIRVEDRVVVVEGYMDYLALAQAGIGAVVATLGTALTEEHARLLKRLTRNVIVLFDGDEAGREAAERSLPLLLAQELVPRSLVLPDGLDPDDFVKKSGRPALEELLKAAPELFSVIFDRHLRAHPGGSADKILILDRICGPLRAATDQRLKSLYIRDVADRLGIESTLVAQAMAQVKPENAPAKPVAVSVEKKQGSPASPIVRAPQISLKGAPVAELYMLNIALMKEKYFQVVKALIAELELKHEGIQKAFSRLDEMYRQMPSKFDSLTALLVVEVDPPESVSLQLKPPLADLNEEGAEKLLADCARKIREAGLRAKSRLLRADLRAQGTIDQLDKLEQIMNIHRQRNSLNKDDKDA